LADQKKTRYSTLVKERKKNSNRVVQTSIDLYR